MGQQSSTENAYRPVIIRTGVLDCQACVPIGMTDDEIVAFANRVNPCGTKEGWHIRREGSPLLNGDPERQPCSDRDQCFHVMLDA